MPDWSKLIAQGDIAGILVLLVLVLITGGVGQAIISGIANSRRGIKGDALIKEQNGINGLDALSTQQGGFIKALQEQLVVVKEESDQKIADLKEEFTDKLNQLTRDLRAEMAYSNLLISTLSEATVPIPPRPLPEVADRGTVR